MSDTAVSNLQLTRAVLQRRTGADAGPNEPNVLSIEGVAARNWVADLGRQGRARVDEAMLSAAEDWRSSDAAGKAERLARELATAESAEGEARRAAGSLEDELSERLDAGRDTALVEERLAGAKAELARVAVRAGVLRHLLQRARADARDRLRRALESARLQLQEEARREHQAALRALEQAVCGHFPAVNRAAYVFALTKAADVTEHNLRLAGFGPPTAVQERSAG